MDPIFLLILLIPLLVPFGVKIFTHGSVTFPELAVCVVVTFLSGALVFYAGRYSEARDVEVWNGMVTEKYHVRYQCYINGSNGCRHYHDCNCHIVCTGSGNDRTCHQECDSCPDYPWEQDWLVKTTIGGYDLGRKDRQGKNPSSKWEKSYVEEPVSDVRPYTNWVKAAPDSLFNDAKVGLNPKILEKIPVYPKKLYDTWYLDRVVAVGMQIPNLKQWNFELQKMLSGVGPQKQVNMVLMFFANEDRAIRNAVRVKWLGGKKNDVVLMIGLNGNKVAWTDVLSWSKNGVFDVELRESINELGLIDLGNPASVLEVARKNIASNYIRRPMAEFEYLKKEIQPPTWVVVFTFLFSLAVSVGTSIAAHRNEFFNQRKRYR